MSSTSTSNGLVLILFGQQKGWTPQTKGGATRSQNTRSKPPKEEDTSEEIRQFEEFLDHCTFTLESAETRTTVRLDTQLLLARPTYPILPSVEAAEDWKVVLSRYRYSVNPADAPLLMTQPVWILKLKGIRRTAEFPYAQGEGEEYYTSVVCFPQAWLPWISNDWFLANHERDWFIQEGDNFGIPSVKQTRANEECDCAEQRYYFRLFNVPNTATTAISQGRTAVDVSEQRVLAQYTDSGHGIHFPSIGVMYVIVVDIPAEYQIARRHIDDKRECVLCADTRPHVDRGVVFGTCGHYVCYDCCKEYKKDITTATACYYCRAPTAINLDSLVEHNKDDTDQGESQSKKSRTDPELSPGTQLKCMFSLLQKL